MIAYVVYKLVSCISTKIRLFGKLEAVLKKKLFYSGILRYMITAYLSLASNFFTFFLMRSSWVATDG